MKTALTRIAHLGLIAISNACTDTEETVAPVSQSGQDVRLAPAAPPAGFTSRKATVNGVTISYLIGGQGKPVVLLHGWPQTPGLIPQQALSGQECERS